MRRRHVIAIAAVATCKLSYTYDKTLKFERGNCCRNCFDSQKSSKLVEMSDRYFFALD